MLFLRLKSPSEDSCKLIIVNKQFSLVSASSMKTMCPTIFLGRQCEATFVGCLRAQLSLRLALLEAKIDISI